MALDLVIVFKALQLVCQEIKLQGCIDLSVSGRLGRAWRCQSPAASRGSSCVGLPQQSSSIIFYVDHDMKITGNHCSRLFFSNPFKLLYGQVKIVIKNVDINLDTIADFTTESLPIQECSVSSFFQVLLYIFT